MLDANKPLIFDPIKEIQMLKQAIQDVDLDGKPITEEFYFNLTEAELVKLELKHDGGMQAHLQSAIDSGKGSRIIEVFEELASAAYGRRSADGRFLKKPEWFDEITASEAYSKFFMRLVTEAEFGAEFVNGIMPAKLMAKARAAAEQERKQDEPGSLTAADFRQENGDALRPVDTTPHMTLVSESAEEYRDLPPWMGEAPKELDKVPPLSEEDFKRNEIAGIRSVLVNEDAAEELTHFGDDLPIEGTTNLGQTKLQRLLAKPKTKRTKEDILALMQLKSAPGRVLTAQEVSGMNPTMLEMMLEAGAEVEGL